MILQGIPPSKEEVVETIRQYWPDLVVEDDGDDYFIYKNEAAKKSWDGEGWSETNDADMIYVLPREDVTVVIDDNKQLSYMVEAIQELMKGDS